MFEHYFTPYQSSRAVIGDRIAILAPHPDDEVFGCGGSASKWAAQGKTVQAFILTAGVVAGEFGTGPEADHRHRKKAQQRAEESRQAAHVLGLPEPVFFAAQDGQLWDDSSVAEQLFQQLSLWQPTTLVLPSIWEMHRDHRTTAELGLALAKRLPSVEMISFYEVGVPLIANVIEDISAYQECKWLAMQCFVSQLTAQHYAEQIQGLNTYRTYTLGLSVSSAEAFHCIVRSDIADFERTHNPTQTTHALRQAEGQQQRQQARINELEHRLAAIVSSRSWRMTSVLRMLRARLGRSCNKKL